MTRGLGVPMQLPYETPTKDDTRVIAVLKEASEQGGRYALGLSGHSL